MPLSVYSLDDAISSFFSIFGPSVSRKQCDGLVQDRYGQQAQPTSMQGVTSYTVIAGPKADKVIQFREETALLDIEMLVLAKSIHRDIVPACCDLGWIGDPDVPPKLAVYEMERLPGENYIFVRSPLAHDQHLNTVLSLANFFAQLWQSSAQKDAKLYDMSAVSSECYARFGHLAANLPERFQGPIVEVQASLPALLEDSYPVVLTHSDLNEMNILVDPASGDITGIVDWAGASFLPFGFALYALENALGSMGPGGWTWFEQADNLRDVFWKTPKAQTGLSEAQERLVRVAGKAGILIRYGTAHDSGFAGMVGVRDPAADADGDLQYLDALLL